MFGRRVSCSPPDLRLPASHGATGCVAPARCARQLGDAALRSRLCVESSLSQPVKTWCDSITRTITTRGVRALKGHYIYIYIYMLYKYVCAYTLIYFL